MRIYSVTDGPESFDLTVFEPEKCASVVLFAVGGGGNPERHAPMLKAFAARDCLVVAPHFERLVSPMVTADHFLLRARRLSIALDSLGHSELPVTGVGHSIGATTLLALAGARLSMNAAGPLPIATCGRIEQLALMAPATGFFQAPGAFEAMHTPLIVWAATHDAITPVAQAEFLKHTLGAQVPVDLRICEGAGHFSFMHMPPPNTTEPLVDRDAFLAQLTEQLCACVAHGTRVQLTESLPE